MAIDLLKPKDQVINPNDLRIEEEKKKIDGEDMDEIT